jgi:hypothetical protein
MTTTRRLRQVLVTGAVVAGASLGAAGIASAATGGSTGSSAATATVPSSGSATAPPGGSGRTPAPGDPATMTHGPNETLLTGTDLQKATAAAEAAEPGATVVRAETDSSGTAPYEVHMKKADGSYVTVELNSDFVVATTESGFGPGPAGAGPGGRPAPPSGSGSGSGSGNSPSSPAA